MGYLHVWACEDGIRINVVSKKEIMEDLAEEAEYNEQHHFIESLKELSEMDWELGDWENTVCYLKADVIVPRPVEKVTEWEID